MVNIKEKERMLQSKENKWEYKKLKIFCTVKKMISKMNRQPMEWEKFCKPWNQYVKEIFAPYVHSSIYNSQDMGTTKVSTDRWMDNVVVCI